MKLTADPSLLLMVAAVVAAISGAAPPHLPATDLELVLAIDASSSVDIGEYALQLRGIAAGFRDPAVRRAIRAGPNARIAVAVVIWAEQKYRKYETGWRIIAGDADAEAFATEVETLRRHQFGGTGIGEGIKTAVHSIAANDIDGTRRVIDVSGDGRETPEPGAIELSGARALADDAGVVINGLAVENEDAGLLSYYDHNVRTGAGSFVMAATDYFDFVDAMRRKLLREITGGPQVASAGGRRGLATTLSVTSSRRAD